MNKAEKKEYVFNKLLELLKPQGYYLVKTGLDPTFVLKEKDRVVFFIFNFNDSGSVVMSKAMISFTIIEDIMFEIKKPNQDYSFLDNKKYFLTTIEDKFSSGVRGFDKNNLEYVVSNQEQLVFFTNWIINYLDTASKEFIERYSHLPSILFEMDRLESENLTWNNREKGILIGSLDAYFRGLIISKLCNDPKFNDKIEKMNLKFNQAGYEEWIPYYEKLKNKLDTLMPIYNLK